VSNSVAITMYENLGYTVYRKVIEYYSGEKDEDAYDMRKALSIDTKKLSVIPLKNDVHIDDLEY
jgi:N-terminal acetyltransferase B complex catalytic subunit